MYQKLIYNDFCLCFKIIFIGFYESLILSCFHMDKTVMPLLAIYRHVEAF